MLVESMAVAYWRARCARQCENGLVRRGFVSWKRNIEQGYFQPSAEQAAITGDLRLPSGRGLDQILRYEAANHRHLMSLWNHLDRLQRARKDEKCRRRLPVTFQKISRAPRPAVPSHSCKGPPASRWMPSTRLIRGFRLEHLGRRAPRHATRRVTAGGPCNGQLFDAPVRGTQRTR